MQCRTEWQPPAQHCERSAVRSSTTSSRRRGQRKVATCFWLRISLGYESGLAPHFGAYPTLSSRLVILPPASPHHLGGCCMCCKLHSRKRRHIDHPRRETLEKGASPLLPQHPRNAVADPLVGCQVAQSLRHQPRLDDIDGLREDTRHTRSEAPERKRRQARCLLAGTGLESRLKPRKSSKCEADHGHVARNRRPKPRVQASNAPLSDGLRRTGPNRLVDASLHALLQHLLRCLHKASAHRGSRRRQQLADEHAHARHPTLEDLLGGWEDTELNGTGG
mmetsp:Transcript_17135/g.41252  ORF Transcript_17135/g.41252 Transcript_17135/m.41252 type:complete len:278 (+) Transcript_17135:166-999(+)